MMTLLLTIFATETFAVPEQTAPALECAASKQLIAKVQPNPTVQETLNNGRFIKLSDDSLWEINPEDTAITESWISPAEIIVSIRNDMTYPYQLTNSITKSKVRARKATSIPKPAQPPVSVPKTTAPTQTQSPAKPY